MTLLQKVKARTRSWTLRIQLASLTSLLMGGIALFVFIVWWTLPRRRKQDGDDPPK